jgi:hypothetical protein
MIKSVPRFARAAPPLATDCQGAATVEFALISPILFLTMLGFFDLAQNIYTSAMLEGGIEQAAREASIEGATASVDGRVTNAVRRIAPNAQIQFTRMAYEDYSDVAKPEDFTDINSDGRCNNGEPFEDVNGNRRWDADRGVSGFGNAREAVHYRVTVTHDRAFPIHRLIPAMPAQVTTVANTVLRNQPYRQQTRQPTVGNCS